MDSMAPLKYDYLVLALGAVVNFFQTPGADQIRLTALHNGRCHPAQRQRPKDLRGSGQKTAGSVPELTQLLSGLNEF